MKVVSLKKSSAEKKSDKESGMIMPYDDEHGGVSVHLSHHHLKKMGLDGSLKSGHKVKFRGHGHVEESESRSDKGGERYHARLRLTHAGAERGADSDGDFDDKAAERKGRRKDIESAVEEDEVRRK